MNKQPEVTKATRQKLMNAFWDIFSKNGISKVTVGAVTKAAGYNRGTFYQYFLDIYDILEQLENELLHEIENQITEAMKKNPPQDMKEFCHICAVIATPISDKIYILSSSDSNFISKFKEKLRENILLLDNGFVDNDDFEYVLSFIVSSVLGLLSYWYESGKKIDTETFITMIQGLISNGVYGYLSPNNNVKEQFALMKNCKLLK